MDILAPFSKQEEVEKLVNAGATELYCGLVDANWNKKYSLVSSINLRHDQIANLSSFGALGESIESAHSAKAKVFLTLNAHFYSEKQLPLVLKQAEKAVSLGIDSLIVADSGLIPKLANEFDVEISLSTGNPVFNSKALEFFKELGVGRVVFPRHLTVKEAVSLAAHAKKLGLKTECFVLNVICPYIDGLCTFQHIVEKNLSFVPVGPLACRADFKATAIGSASPEKKFIAENHAMLWSNSISRDCGLCAIDEFKGGGVDCVKIAGRAHSIEKKLADVNAVKAAIDAAGSKGFKGTARELYFRLFHNKCDYPNCYYGGVGFGES